MKTIYNFILEKLNLNNDSKISQKNVDPYDPTDWKAGDILCGTWGYNMTIPVFYRIEKRTSKSFTIVELEKKLVSGHYNGQFEEEPDLKAKSTYKQQNVRINKHGHLYITSKRVLLHKWDGKPIYGNDMD